MMFVFFLRLPGLYLYDAMTNVSQILLESMTNQPNITLLSFKQKVPGFKLFTCEISN